MRHTGDSQRVQAAAEHLADIIDTPLRHFDQALDAARYQLVLGDAVPELSVLAPAPREHLPVDSQGSRVVEATRDLDDA